MKIVTEGPVQPWTSQESQEISLIPKTQSVLLGFSSLQLPVPPRSGALYWASETLSIRISLGHSLFRHASFMYSDGWHQPMSAGPGCSLISAAEISLALSFCSSMSTIKALVRRWMHQVYMGPWVNNGVLVHAPPNLQMQNGVLSGSLEQTKLFPVWGFHIYLEYSPSYFPFPPAPITFFHKFGSFFPLISSI